MGYGRFQAPLNQAEGTMLCSELAGSRLGRCRKARESHQIK